MNFKRISDHEYFSINAFSSSGCKTILKSPLHYKALYIDRRFSKKTEAMKFGSLVHTVVLDKRVTDLVIEPKFDLRKKGAKEAQEDYRNSLDKNALSVSEDEYYSLNSIVESIAAHPFASEILLDGLVEHCGLYFDEEEKVQVKFKPDIVNLKNGYVADLKTCADASHREFQRSIVNFGYEIQAYHYLSSMNQIQDAAINDFYFVCIEKDPPYAVVVYRADNDMITSGKRKYRKGIEIYAQCLRTSSWPGYSTVPVSIGLPPWSM